MTGSGGRKTKVPSDPAGSVDVVATLGFSFIYNMAAHVKGDGKFLVKKGCCDAGFSS